MNLRDKTITGVGWSAIGRGVNLLGQLITSIVLIRLLLPEDYGLLAMALVFTGFATLFTEFGFSKALVQRQQLEPAHTTSTFWANLVAGLLLAVAFYAVAPGLAIFYETPALKPVARWISLTFLLGSFGIVPRALLEREMAFKTITKVEITAVLVAGGVAVTLALLGGGVWSLVAQLLCHQALQSILFWTYTSWRPGFSFSWPALRDLMHYGANLTGFNIINYWARQADDLLIGKVMGLASLGIYNRAYTLMLLPLTQVTSLLSRVMFPALSRIQHDKGKVRWAYLRMIQLVAFITFPMMIGLFVVAEPFVATLFGPTWAGVTPVIQILCFVGMVQALMNPVGLIYTSQGYTHWMLWWGSAAAAVVLIAIGIGVALGTVLSVALAYLIANLLLLYPCIAIPGRLIDLTFTSVIEHAAPAAFCSVIMAGLTWSISQMLPAGWPAWAILAVQLPTGILSYVVLVHQFNLEAYRNVRMVLDAHLHRRTAVALT